MDLRPRSQSSPARDLYLGAILGGIVGFFACIALVATIAMLYWDQWTESLVVVVTPTPSMVLDVGGIQIPAPLEAFNDPENARALSGIDLVNTSVRLTRDIGDLRDLVFELQLEFVQGNGGETIFQDETWQRKVRLAANEILADYDDLATFEPHPDLVAKHQAEVQAAAVCRDLAQHTLAAIETDKLTFFVLDVPDAFVARLEDCQLSRREALLVE